jgi:hypothetical protein
MKEFDHEDYLSFIGLLARVQNLEESFAKLLKELYKK